jgi:hypothetical protein
VGAGFGKFNSRGDKNSLSKYNLEHAWWHVAVERFSSGEFEKVWEWATENLNPEELKIELLAKDDVQRTVLHLATGRCDTKMFHKISVWAKEKLLPEEVRNVFLGKDVQKKCIHLAADRYVTNVSETIWEWTKQNLNPEELKNALLTKDRYGQQKFLYIAAKNTNSSMFQKVWQWSAEALNPEEIKQLLLAKDFLQQTILHLAAGNFNPEAIDKLWGSDHEESSTVGPWSSAEEDSSAEEVGPWWGAEEDSSREEVKMNCYYPNRLSGKWLYREATPIYLRKSGSGLQTHLLQRKQKKIEICHSRVLARRRFGKTYRSRLQGSRSPRRGRNEELLLNENGDGQTTSQVAAEKTDTTMFRKIWEWAKLALAPEEIKQLLIVKARCTTPVLHLVINNLDTEVFDTVWEWA